MQMPNKIERIVKENFLFIKKINKLNYHKNKFDFAKDYCAYPTQYQNELIKRIAEIKKSLDFKKNFKLKKILNKVEIKLNYLISINYFKKKFFINRKELILSPCDFHFKNMLFQKKIFYVDFEYSGLDDPAKLYSVYFLQPEANFSLLFFLKIIKKILFFGTDNKKILNKIIYLMPICYLRWTLIMLNEFSVRNSKKRIFAYQRNINIHEKNIQIKKAERFLKEKINFFYLYKASL
jgi:hypothetical protein